MHILLFVISCLKMATVVQIFAHVGVEPYDTFKFGKTELFLTMSHPWADLLWQMPHPGEGKVKKSPTNARGEGV